jgi:hypothetical protein
MSIADVLSLLKFLDDLFSLGGKLVAAARQTHPELNVEPLPDLAMDAARDDAVKRTGDQP